MKLINMTIAIIKLIFSEKERVQFETLCFLEDSIKEVQEQESWDKFFSCPKVNRVIEFQIKHYC